MEDKYIDKVLDTCLTAGKLMIENGSEMYRVEDTMHRIANNAGLPDARLFTTPTGLFIGLDSRDKVQIEEIADRGINLGKVALVNDLSRQFADGKVDLEEFRHKLDEIEQADQPYPLWLQTLGTAVLSCTLMICFIGNYDLVDFIPAAVIGGIGYLVYVFVRKFTNVRFLSEMLAAVALAILATSLQHLFPVMNEDNILIGSLMVLVPGLTLTNALRDLVAGHLISGIARGVEASMTAVALGGGVAVVMRFLGV